MRRRAVSRSVGSSVRRGAHALICAPAIAHSRRTSRLNVANATRCGSFCDECRPADSASIRQLPKIKSSLALSAAKRLRFSALSEQVNNLAISKRSSTVEAPSARQLACSQSAGIIGEDTEQFVCGFSCKFLGQSHVCFSLHFEYITRQWAGEAPELRYRINCSEKLCGRISAELTDCR